MPICRERQVNDFWRKAVQYIHDQDPSFDRIRQFLHPRNAITDGHAHQVLQYKNGHYSRKLFAIYDPQRVQELRRRWFPNVSFRVNNETWFLTNQVGFTDWDQQVFNKIFEPYEISVKRDSEGFIVLDSVNPVVEAQHEAAENIDAILTEPVIPIAVRQFGLQKIFFGAPGTGKSYKIEKDLFKDENSQGYGLDSLQDDQKFRTTFHPDYDYAQFVGTYKPKKDADGRITYLFVPQVFAEAYVAAWTKFLKQLLTPPVAEIVAANEEDDDENSDNSVYLVIEEINRGNCAQIFGDIFQLLDRDNEGYSQYSVNADFDFAEYIKQKLTQAAVWEKYDEYVGNGKIKLPPNFNILATMNTSDQSLFPMDSAFKRRFDWEYVPINYMQPAANVVVELPAIGGRFRWLDFLQKVNENISKVTLSEDKQMGEFFIRLKNGSTISFDEFRSKVLFYLWDSVYKDESENESAKLVYHFDLVAGKKASFQTLFEERPVDQQGLVKKMLENLNVSLIGSTPANAVESTEND